VTDVRALLESAIGDRYAVDRELGRGGMAIVYAATDRRHHRAVAIKVMMPGIAAALGADRFEQEIATAAGLAHPHIVPVFDSGMIGTGASAQPYYVMPLIEGRSLRDRLDREGPLPIDEALAIGRDIGSALSFAHAHGVIHRDVKPENILLAGGQALLTDFGIARPIDEPGRKALTGTGFAVGTPAYMSPEQLAPGSKIDGRADLYALAVTLYEALGDDLPFDGPTPQAALARQLAGEVRPLHTVRPAVDHAVDRVLQQALAPSPADRFARVEDFIAAIDAARGSGGGAPRAPRRRRIAMAVGGLALVAAVTAIWVMSRPRGPSDGRLGLAIMPFRAPDSALSLGETLPDLMATLLAGTPNLRIADPWALWRPLRADPQARARSPDPIEAEKVAARSKADRIVLGRIDQEPTRLTLSVRIYGIGVTGEALDQFTVHAPIDSTEGLARQAAVEVLSRIWTGTDPAARSDLAATSLTQSPEALKAYLEAREAMRRGQPDSADAAIQRSLARDSTFTLALIEAVNIRTWAMFLRGQPFLGLRELVQRALPKIDSLPERHRLRLLAAQASIETDGPRSAAAWKRLIELDSTDVEAWNGLAYVHLVYGWQYGATEVDLREAVDRAAALDATYVPLLFRRAQLAAFAMNDLDARKMIDELGALDAASPLLRGARLGLEALVASDTNFAASLPDFTATAPIEWGSIFRRLRAHRPDRALALARQTREREGPGFKFNFAASVEAGLLAALGRWREVDSLSANGVYAAVAALDQGLAWKRVAAALPGVAETTGVRRAVAALTARVPIDSAPRWVEVAPVWKVGWLLGAYHATHGDTAIAARWRATLEMMPRGNLFDWAGAEAADIGSRLHQRKGSADSAASLAAAAFRAWTIKIETAQDEDPEPAIRFRRAEGLLAVGRTDSAAAVFRSLIPPTTWAGLYTTRALLELGAIAARRGDPNAAARYFDWAMQYLELGGPEMAAWLVRARDGLQESGVARPFRFGRS